MERGMKTEPGDVVVGLMMAVFALLGLFLAAGAMDDEMYVFGFSLTAFAVLFVFGLIRRHFDRHAASRNAGHV
jgi:hypothetical protein